jgi:hypothetical protein
MFTRFILYFIPILLIISTGDHSLWAQKSLPEKKPHALAWSLGGIFISQQTGYFNRQINLSNYNPEPTYGKAAGIGGKIHLNNKYFIQWQALNSFQGQKYSYNQEETDTAGNITSLYLYTRSFELNYYKFPIMPGVVINPGKRIQLHAAIGPQIGYLNTAYYVLDADTIIRKDRSFKQTLKKLDVGIVLTSGFFAKITRHIYFNTALRFDISLLDTESIRFKPVAYASSKNFTGGISFGLLWVFHPENISGALPISAPK